MEKKKINRNLIIKNVQKEVRSKEAYRGHGGRPLKGSPSDWNLNDCYRTCVTFDKKQYLMIKEYCKENNVFPFKQGLKELLNIAFENYNNNKSVHYE